MKNASPGPELLKSAPLLISSVNVHCQNVQMIKFTDCRLCLRVVTYLRGGTMSSFLHLFQPVRPSWETVSLQPDLGWNPDSLTISVTGLRQVA